MRTYIFEDLLARTLRLSMPLKHVMNVTDVGHLVSDADEGEDKMEVATAREGKSAWDIAKFYEQKFFEDFDALHCTRPTVISRATAHIPEMIALVKTLEEKGYTYRTSDGIYYDTSKFPRYDALVGRSRLEGLKGGARVEMSAEKRNPTDFALWKFSPKDKKRQMEWDSPWGVGFPGWHVECSAMAMKYLGPTVDIHCGGIDHVSVHHTNEIAQSEAATGQKYVRCWVHGEFLVLRAGKMSKSGGTFVTLQTLRDKGYDPLDYRYLCLTAHYRTQLEFTYESLDASRKSLQTLRREAAKAVPDRRAPAAAADGALGRNKKQVPRRHGGRLKRAQSPGCGVGNAARGGAECGGKSGIFKICGRHLGAGRVPRPAGRNNEELPQEVKDLLARRAEARAAKDYKKSDELRAALAAAGYAVKDTPQGQQTEKIK